MIESKQINSIWFDNIPKTWNDKKFKYVTDFLNGYAFKSDDYVQDGMPVIRIGDVKPIIDLEETKKLPESYLESAKEYIIKKNDILLALTGATIGKSCIYYLDEPVLLNQRVAVIRPLNEIENGYLKYLIDSREFKSFINYECDGGAQENIGKEDIGNLLIPIPPKIEQSTIANYLDQKTAQIDKLIVNKQKLIELLKEERIAIINQAVTKGIDPKTKLKPSGIEWLGNIPTHWEVKKLKYVAEVQSSNVDKKSHEDEVSILLCNYIDVYKNEFINDSILFMEATAKENEIEKFLLQEGDVLITKDSETSDDIANPVYVTKDFKNVICGYHLAQIKSNKTELTGVFLFRLFQSREFNSHFEVSANGVTRFGLPLASITDVFVLLPPIGEQLIIVQHIETETQKIDNTISKIEKEIELLQEYRTALISEVVTGKVKVV